MTPYKGIKINNEDKTEMLEMLDFLQQDIVIGSPIEKTTEFKKGGLSLTDLSKLPKSFFNYFEIVQV